MDNVTQICLALHIPLYSDITTEANGAYCEINVHLYKEKITSVQVLGIKLSKKYQNLFVVAHELTHAIGANLRPHLLCRRAKDQNCTTTATRIEEAIADLVAEALTLQTRAQHGYMSYPPVKPGTRNYYYVQRKAEETLDYIIQHMENI